MAVTGITNTTTVQAALAPDAQSAIDSALNRLSNFNQIPVPLPDNENNMLNLTSYFGASQVADWKQPYANEIRDLANKQPPLSAQQINDAANKIITRFECKVTFMREMRFMMFQQMMESMQSLLDEVLNVSPV